MKVNNLIVAAILVGGLVKCTDALAHHHPHHHWHRDCILDRTYAVGSTRLSADACKTEDPLQLVTIQWSYPNLGGEEYPVKIWQGSFSKLITLKVFYVHDVYDLCEEKNISHSEYSAIEQYTAKFAIENPNLSAEVKATYEHVPMTDEEAKEELAKQKDLCDKY